MREHTSAVPLVLMVLLCAGAGGCELMQRSAAPIPPRSIPYHRVGVLQFEDRSRYSGTGDEFTNLLAQEMARLTISTDVVVIPRSALPKMSGRDPLAEGCIPLKVLTDVRERYRVQALVLGSLDDHNPYWKPFAHISVKIMDTGDAKVLCEFSDRWDAGCPRDEREIRAFYRRNRERDECRFGPDLFTISPRYFLMYVSNSVAHRMLAAL